MTYTSDCIPTFHYHSSCYCHLQAVPYTARKLSLRPLAINRRCEILYLLTVRHVMILFYVFIYIFNSLHVSTTSCSSSGEINCVNTTSGSCHSVSVAVSCAGLPTCIRHGHRYRVTATRGCIDKIWKIGKIYCNLNK